jgi:4-diphosphocytidyl-2-C-methyl-D-erythritol kinase
MMPLRIRAFAKVNLTLPVFNTRGDGYHELRTVFQTVSLCDSINLSFVPGRRTSILLDSSVEIADNLMIRAARLVLDATRVSGEVRMNLRKNIPMGGGLGGGSSDAAAVLNWLPRLVGKAVDPDKLHDIASALGSDVPFFLIGGTAAGLGRGEELYPLPDFRGGAGLILVPPLAVSTAEAYSALDRDGAGQLTATECFNKMKRFQSFVRGPFVWASENDFEAVVFAREPLLKRLHGALRRSGATLARMSGSGSALFGLYGSRDARDAACAALGRAYPRVRVEPVSLVTRSRYRAANGFPKVGIETHDV